MTTIDLINANSYDYMAAMPDKCVDVTICDPPYTELVHKNAKSFDGKRVMYADINFDPLQSYDFVRQLLRVTKRWVICFCALEQLGDYQRSCGKKEYVRSGVYRRCQSTPQISGDRPGQACEGLAIMSSEPDDEPEEYGVAIMHQKGKKKWNGRGSHAFWQFARDRGHRFHPTQKPILLMEDLVYNFSNEGELVFDPFMGSGTTGVAAAHLGRNFLGIEIDENMFGVAKARIDSELGVRIQYASREDQVKKQLPLIGVHT